MISELSCEQIEDVARLMNRIHDIMMEVKEAILRAWNSVTEYLRTMLEPHIDRLMMYIKVKNLLDAGIKPESIKYIKIRKGIIT